MTVDIVLFSPNAVPFMARENGIFEEHGLNVRIERAASPISVVASLVAGQAQFGFVSTPVLINANREGTPVEYVAPIDGQVSPESDASAPVASKESGIDSFDDLSGETEAVVQLAGTNLIGAKKLIEAPGATGNEYVALPVPQMPQALTEEHAQAQVIQTNYVPEINLESIADIQDPMKEQGSIDSTVDPEDLVRQP